ncbi:unnamed protein product, partial [Sphacelaria rigidula]
MTNCECIERTIRKRQLWFGGALVQQNDTRLPKRVMNGRLCTRGPTGADCPPKQREAVPHEGARRKLFVYGVDVNDAYDWVTAAKNLGKWHIEVDKGAEEFKGTYRCADKREPDCRHRREAA